MFFKSIRLSIAFIMICMPLQSAANEMLEALRNELEKGVENLGEMLHDLENDGLEGMIDGLQERVRRDSQGKEPIGRGYCQLWGSNLLTHQSECEVYRVCDERQTCDFRFVWSKGEEMAVRQVGDSYFFANGNSAELIQYGPDSCLSKAPSGYDFCFTEHKQSPELMMRR